MINPRGSSKPQILVRLLVWAVMSLFFASTASFRSQAGESLPGEGIRFLHLRLKDGLITMVDSSTRPGVLKPTRDGDKGEIGYEILDVNGAILGRGALRDPSLRRYEYSSPDEPGKIAVKEVKLDEVEFTLRLPHHASARRIVFHRLGSGANETSTNLNTRRILGTINLAPRRGGD